MNFKNHTRIIGVMVLLVVSLSGCTVVVVGAAVGAAGAYVWSNGNLEFSTQHSAEDLYTASKDALDERDILVDRDRHDHFGANISGRTNAGRKVLIKIMGKTEYTSTIRVRVGVLGDQYAAQELLNLILSKA